MTLSNITNDQFGNAIANLNLTNIQSNETIIDSILNLRPNFNYLYSNISETYRDPMSLLSTFVSPNIINSLYGNNLEVC